MFCDLVVSKSVWQRCYCLEPSGTQSLIVQCWQASGVAFSLYYCYCFISVVGSM